jgi:hypothetical protein
MSDRIDLTQFEGIVAWEVEKRTDGGYAIKTGRDNFSLEEAETIAKLPNLIAELKRCYKLLDDADDAMSRYGDEEEHQDIDNVCDAYEAVCNALAGLGRW